jgi:hypothetical protein
MDFAKPRSGAKMPPAMVLAGGNLSPDPIRPDQGRLPRSFYLMPGMVCAGQTHVFSLARSSRSASIDGNDVGADACFASEPTPLPVPTKGRRGGDSPSPIPQINRHAPRWPVAKPVIPPLRSHVVQYATIHPLGLARKFVAVPCRTASPWQVLAGQADGD